MNAPQDLPVAKDQVIAIHDVAIARFGGLPGVRDEGLLDSALAQPWQTFGGRDLYEGDVAKVCRLYCGVIRNHPFTDGNKRTGAALLGASLRLCGHHFKPATTTSCGRCQRSPTAACPTSSSSSGSRRLSPRPSP